MTCFSYTLECDALTSIVSYRYKKSKTEKDLKEWYEVKVLGMTRIGALPRICWGCGGRWIWKMWYLWASRPLGGYTWFCGCLGAISRFEVCGTQSTASKWVPCLQPLASSPGPEALRLGTYSPPGSSVHGVFQARLCSGLPFPSLGDLCDPGIKPASTALAGRLFTTESPMMPILILALVKYVPRTSNYSISF